MASQAGYTSIAGLQEAVDRGETSIKSVVEGYIKTIEAKNPTINAFTQINKQAIDDAAALDEVALSHRGPLHGIPIAIKDNIEVSGLPTAFGSKACRDYMPASDASIVRRLRDAGVVILGKVTVPDWAASFFSTSSLSGTTKNPVETARDTGGSSAGSAASVASGMALASIGAGVRLPASYCGLVGVRCTPGRISGHGISPLLSRQDTAGPMTRSVLDAARILDVIVGFDQKDPATSVDAIAPLQGTFLDATRNASLKGKKLGVVREVFGEDPGILSVMEETLGKLRSAGAELIEIVIPDLEHYKAETFFHYESKSNINEFLSSRPELSHLNVDHLFKEAIFHPVQDHFELLAKGPNDPTTLPLFGKQLLIQKKFKEMVASLYAKHKLDALIYPTSQVLPPKTADVLEMKVSTVPYPTNTVIAAQLHFPAMSVPVGRARDDSDGPQSPKLPVGLEIVGLPLRDLELIAVGAGVEAAMQLSRTYS